jgi:hypothetical protein
LGVVLWKSLPIKLEKRIHRVDGGRVPRRAHPDGRLRPMSQARNKVGPQ